MPSRTAFLSIVIIRALGVFELGVQTYFHFRTVSNEIIVIIAQERGELINGYKRW